MRTFVNKFIAHGAAPRTRGNLTPSQRGISIDQLSLYIKKLLEVASKINTKILYNGSSIGTFARNNSSIRHFANKWVAPQNIERAKRQWREIAKKVNGWAGVEI